MVTALKKYVTSFFPGRNFYLSAAGIALLFVVAYFLDFLYAPASFLFSALIALTVADYFFLFVMGKAPQAQRIIGDRLSNGDQNEVGIKLRNRMPFPIRVEIIDELPEQFQERNFKIKRRLKKNEERTFNYKVIPGERGEYDFGNIVVYFFSGIGLVKRRHIELQEQTIPVYPSFLHLRKYQLAAEASISEQGSRRMRKIGHSMEFEQIKDYVAGDDVRNVNWKATARRGSLMVNNYVDERSQQVYCIIDKGRLMKMPFNNLSLLDYAINSTLVLSDVCLRKQDKIGLITFSERMGDVIPADRKPVQLERLLQVLYRQKTAFLESDFEMLYTQVRHKIRQRSLLVLYTNFESVNALKRKLPYLRAMARYHLLLVVFFENTELVKLSQSWAGNVEDVYVGTIAEKFAFEKRLIVKELQQYGILTLLSAPENLSINTINKYLELKSRQAV